MIKTNKGLATTSLGLGNKDFYIAHNVLIWQAQSNLAIPDIIAQRSLISATMSLLKIHGHFYAQKVCISCKKNAQNFRTSFQSCGKAFVTNLKNLPCVVCPLVGIQKHLALHIFGPNFGWFKFQIIMDGRISFDVFVSSTPTQYCESPLRRVRPPFVLTFGCRSQCRILLGVMLCDDFLFNLSSFTE